MNISTNIKTIARNTGAVILGLVVGSVVNMTLIKVSGHVIAPPEGADLSTYEGLKSTIHLFGPEHYLFPFLAHALGTLAGAALAATLAVSRKAGMALVIGFFFLAGGIANVAMLPSPLWFDVVDLTAAYLPMGWLGGQLARAKR